MRLIKISELSTPAAILLSGLIVGLSIFLTTYIFFGGVNNRTKLFLDNPARFIPTNGYQNTYPIQAQMPRPIVGTSTIQSVSPTSPTTTPKAVSTPTVKPKTK